MRAFVQAFYRKMMMFNDLIEAFRKLKQVNREPAYREYREQYLELILAVLTTFAAIDILGGMLIDYLGNQPHLIDLLIVRVVFFVLVVSNFAVYLFLANRLPVRIFIYPLFYVFAIASPLLTYFTGGMESPYWFEIIFILITWFMMIPFSYKRLGIHALILAAVYSLIMIPLIPQPINWIEVTEHGMIFIAVFILGMMVAIFNNLFSSSVFFSEQRIAKSEKRFRMFTQNSLDVVWTMDMKSRCFTYMSPSVFNLRGYRPEELIGRPVEESLTPQSQIKVREMLGKAQDEIRKGNMEKVVVGELEQYTKSGGTIWIEVIVSFVTDDEGEIMEVVGDSRNITDRKRAEAELLKIQDQLREESKMLQQENLRIQYESLKNQINPHFLFNSLNVLTSLIKLDPGLAEKFTEQMAKVYRYVLEHKEEDTVTLQTELDFIRSYIFLLEIRFQDKVRFEIDIPENYLNRHVPPLTVQLLIENAVKHNTFSKRNPLQVKIFVDGDDYFNIVNNLQKREVGMGSTAVGLQNIRERFGQLTDRMPEFGERGEEFVARIPLL
ncbi:MAG: histidine kinase [Bacteroidales bacterium]|nr:histidine kinase [Bacteroidales bacterium]